MNCLGWKHKTKKPQWYSDDVGAVMLFAASSLPEIIVDKARASIQWNSPRATSPGYQGQRRRFHRFCQIDEMFQVQPRMLQSTHARLWSPATIVTVGQLNWNDPKAKLASGSVHPITPLGPPQEWEYRIVRWIKAVQIHIASSDTRLPKNTQLTTTDKQNRKDHQNPVTSQSLTMNRIASPERML